ncbi:MAG: transposase [Planctomycetia bacterium]|nr:transposase [Planctomycetia bacterium]OQZ04597.1 MAG: hypothetical protein B6D36_11830 [Planctomycetes bacterium UTPLA1]
MRRHELSDEEWALVETMFPPTGGKGGPWRDHRMVMNGLFWRLRTVSRRKAVNIKELTIPRPMCCSPTRASVRSVHRDGSSAGHPTTLNPVCMGKEILNSVQGLTHEFAPFHDQFTHDKSGRTFFFDSPIPPHHRRATNEP